MSNNIHIDSIAKLHKMLELKAPVHPFITLLDLNKIMLLDSYSNIQIISDLYTIALKDGKDCKIRYGRKYYDFTDGSMMFTAPSQMATIEYKSDSTTGLMLCFHPELLRRNGKNINLKEYSFFSYDLNEALHLSDREESIIRGVFDSINDELNNNNDELNNNNDEFSDNLIVSNIEVLLNYSKRFYGRQFDTREDINRGVVSKFETLISDYFESDKPSKLGIPTVKYLASEMGYSANYFGDLLKKETGRNTKEHIQYYLIEKAKSLLLSTDNPVSTISYNLGFEYPGHFSKLFKLKTGMSPSEYRK